MAMAGGDVRPGKEPATEVDKITEGLRVLAVDDDIVCLRVLEVLLRQCNYQPTIAKDARTALNKLREEQFDLVITDVHMPDMDGFDLLERIGLEMDLPVIMISADGDQATVHKGVAHGACDFLLKPVCIKELKHIWKHLVRKNLGAMNHNSSDSDDGDQQLVIVEGEQGGAKGKKLSKKKKDDGDGCDENKKGMGVPTTRKKPRMSWTSELHRRFLEIVNRLGADKAYPKTILKMMNVDYLTRACVASHLQKYRMYLKKVKNGVPVQSRYWTMGTVGHGGSTVSNVMPWMPGARVHQASGPPVNSFEKISDHTLLDAFSCQSDKEYANFQHECLLEASNVVPSSHPAGKSFANMPNSGMLEPGNQFPLQPSAVSACCEAQFQYNVGNYSNSRENVASSSFPCHIDGAPVIPSQVNIPQMNQMPMLQNEQENQMEGIINNNTTPAVGFSMTPLFSIATDTAPEEMASDNFAETTQIVNGGSISSALPDLQERSVTSTQVHNGGNASGILPVQEGTTDHQAPHDQPINSNPLVLEEIFASMVNQDFNDDVFFGGEF